MEEKNIIAYEKMRKLGAQINFLDRHRRRYITEHLGDTGLVSHQFNILMTLLHNPGISQEILSEMISIDKTRIARSATQLEELGYIERIRNAGNRRRYSLYLTEKGEAMVPRIRQVTAEWGNVVTKEFEPEMTENLIQYLDLMLENSKQ